MAKKQFKAESKKLLDMMINSIYTHKEIFLRELISNGSDAIDKLYYKELTEGGSGVNREDYFIRLEVDKDERILKIYDNGIGMTKEEMEQNLGTIARSGSLNFKNENPADADGDGVTDIDIIGQFGVGFYSAFMVSDKVTVLSQAAGASEIHCWESSGADGYTLKETEDVPGADLEDVTPSPSGTEIILHIKEDTEEENYGEFLDEYGIRGLVRRYSDYIRYPITMVTERQQLKEGSKPDDENPEYETIRETETLNSMVPIWKRQKSQIKDEEYNEFYKGKFMDFVDPMKVIHTSVEGVVSYDALLFIPGQAPFDYYTKEYEKGLQLYSSGVMIMEKCGDLLPDYYSFVKGIVDSPDLSLNISREMLQHDRQLRTIADRLEKKIHSELLELQEKDRAKYDEFFKTFGLQIKFGIYDRMGMNKDKLQDLVMFHSSMEKKPVTLAEYVAKMKEDQQYIYYAAGQSVESIDQLPQTEGIKDKGYEILYLTDDVDEFAIQAMREFDGKEFKSVSAEDMDDLSDEEKEKAKKQEEDSKDLLAFMKETLGDKVAEVKLTQRLKSHPVCLTAKGPVSLEMEKVLAQMPGGEGAKAERVLELNAGHEIMKALTVAYPEDKDKVATYTKILYDQALLIEGLPIDDPVDFSTAVCNLMK